MIFPCELSVFLTNGIEEILIYSEIQCDSIQISNTAMAFHFSGAKIKLTVTAFRSGLGNEHLHLLSSLEEYIIGHLSGDSESFIFIYYIIYFIVKHLVFVFVGKVWHNISMQYKIPIQVENEDTIILGLSLRQMGIIIV